MTLTTNTETIGGYQISEVGNDKFNAELDSIDLGGKVDPEYREAKLLLLGFHLYPHNDTAQVNVMVFGRILVYGLHEALQRCSGDMFLCTAAEKLGIAPGGLKSELDRHSGKIEQLRSVLAELATMETSY